jgi:methylglutamate dehydrogenase subunit B
MRIPCPHCGDRDSQEFVYRGDASVRRPDSDDDMFAYVYLRANVAGCMLEHWYHARGCRNWLVVERDTLTHVITRAAFARDGADD